MKRSLSSLAFKDFDFSKSLRVTKNLGISGIELAPSMIWDQPVSASALQRKQLLDLISFSGLQICALQSLFYACPEANCFSSDKSRRIFIDYFQRMIDLGADLGTKILSFGSYKTRLRESLDVHSANSRFVEVMSSIIDYAALRGIVICIEPIPRFFGCDFINTTKEAIAVIRQLAHPSCRLVLDTGNMMLSDENVFDEIEKSKDLVAHFHANDPKLRSPSATYIDHKMASDALTRSGYNGWVTFEYLSNKPIKEELFYALQVYQ